MRLPFKLAEFAPRVLWASRQARDVWEPRIKAVSAAWIVAERQSVALGRRRSALQHVTPEELPALMAWAAKNGLTALPLAQVKRVTGYKSASEPMPVSGPFDYKVAITEPEHSAAWAEAWAKSDDDKIGELLGTPFCCRKFFQKYWKEERWFDTTVPMVLHYPDQPVLAAKALNMFWRWLGVRPVSHLPCDHFCAQSLDLACDMRDAMPEQERVWLQEILSWPVSYTSYAGQAEITTPILRMNVPTDALAQRVEIRYQGTGYPAEGASGIGFPLRKSAPVVAPLRFVRKSQQPSDNGFTSLEAQDKAHDKLLRFIDGINTSTVIDLGCGDGTLVAKIPADVRIGIETVEERAVSARKRGVLAFTGDCTDRDTLERICKDTKPDLIIAQRFRNPPESLSDYGCRVLSYDYEGGEPTLYDFR